jgi:hypothetical protein
MENFSENKQGRGRPSAIPPEYEMLIERSGLAVDKYSRRSRCNVYYRTRALGCLIFDSENKEEVETFRWLADGEAMKAGKAKS